MESASTVPAAMAAFPAPTGSPPGLTVLPDAGRVGARIEYDRFLDCVHCGLCTSACPTYLETGNENDSPRGRIYLMRGVVDGRIALTDTVRRHLDLCLDCRSCETACPSGVQYGRLIEPFRVDMQNRLPAPKAGGTPGWFQKWFLYGLFPFATRMRWALLPARMMQAVGLDRLANRLGVARILPGPLKRMWAQLPKLQARGGSLPEFLPPIGPKRARVALFTGCVAEAMFPQTNRATARVLQHNGCEVVVPRSQECCGAIHYHSGAGKPALKLATANAAAFAEDFDAIIVNVAGCGSMLKDYGHVAHELAPDDARTQSVLNRFASKVKDVSEFLMQLGPIRPQGELRLKATYHDACHLVHAQRVREQPRDLLSLVPGLELVPLAETEVCCGAAGSYNLTEPEMSERLSARKLENIRRTGAQAVIMGNAGCSIQIQAAVRAAGLDLWIAHPMDVLDLSYRQAPLPRKGERETGGVGE